MPEPPRAGETQQEFLGRCHAYMKTHHPEMPKAQQSAICYSMWRKSKGIKDNEVDENGYILFTCSQELRFEPIEGPMITGENGADPTPKFGENYIHRRITPMRGDMFLDGGFFSNEEANRVSQYWNGTFHDINHKGFGKNGKMDILYFIGHHDNAVYDSGKKLLSVDLHVNLNSHFGKSWQAYIEICQNAGRSANVSTVYLGNVKYINASELPPGTDYARFGYNAQSKVPVLYNVIPMCISTVVRGNCDDSQGCGIQAPATNEANDALKKERQELIAFLKKEDETHGQ